VRTEFHRERQWRFARSAFCRTLPTGAAPINPLCETLCELCETLCPLDYLLRVGVAEWTLPRATHLRRNRRALDVARRCQGARSAVQPGAFPGRDSREAVRLVAATFSSTIRVYSAGEHLPYAIIRLRRPTVSQDASVNSIIMRGSEAGDRRVRLLMPGKWERGCARQRSTGRSVRQGSR
jgi:hypothetical protein